MSVLIATSLTPVAILLLGTIARERIHAYRLEPLRIGVRTMLISIGVTGVRGFLASRGIGGADTSLLFAIAAVAAFTDLQYGYVFDRVLLAGGAGLIIAAAVREGVGAALAGAAAGAVTLAVPWALSRARGLGLGDVKLAGVLGCGLGLYGTLRAIWYAFVIGAIVSMGYILRRRSRGDALPFAPFLALGALLSTGVTAW
ncbi:MAG TPA: A24 family peptidase [Candidatus Baltobacteraceae bacterium]|nr:A24 family peptidase [Candidatus Baltobacteraceae bacterium]